MKRDPSKPWSAEEDKTLQEMRADRATYREIGDALNRSVAAASARFRFLSMTVQQRRKYEASKHRNRKKDEADLVNHRTEGMVVPDEVWADRNRRLAAGYASITAMLCGDPVVGTSQLDKRAGVSA